MSKLALHSNQTMINDEGMSASIVIRTQGDWVGQEEGLDALEKLSARFASSSKFPDVLQEWITGECLKISVPINGYAEGLIAGRNLLAEIKAIGESIGETIADRPAFSNGNY